MAVAAEADVSVCDTRTGRLIAGPLRCQQSATFFGHTLYRVRFSPDGTQLMTTCHDLHARLWDIATAARLAEPLTHRSTVHGQSSIAPARAS